MLLLAAIFVAIVVLFARLRGALSLLGLALIIAIVLFSSYRRSWTASRRSRWRWLVRWLSW